MNLGNYFKSSTHLGFLGCGGFCWVFCWVFVGLVFCFVCFGGFFCFCFVSQMLDLAAMPLISRYHELNT